MTLETQSTRDQKRTWVSGAAATVCASSTIAIVGLPWPTLSPISQLGLILLAVLSAAIAVATAPALFNDWAGLLFCIVLTIVPNLWTWRPELADSSNPLVMQMGRIGLLCLLVGLLTIPIAFIRLMLRHDQTCLTLALSSMALFWVTIRLALRIGNLDTAQIQQMPVQEMVFWTIGIALPLFLAIMAAVMFAVNLLRLLGQELRS